MTFIRSTVIVGLLFGASACGAAGSRASQGAPAPPLRESSPSTPATAQPAIAPDSEAKSTLEIPPPASPSDWRGPLERFLGVPADPDVAMKWDHSLMETGIEECMNAAGFEYVQVAFGSTEDPNEPYFSALSDADLSRYAAARWSQGATYGCDRQASDRVHVLNVMGDVYATYESEFQTDPRVLEAQSRIADCVRAAGGDPDDPQSRHRAECTDKSNWNETAQVVREEVQTRFVLDNAEALIRFMDARPTPREE